MTKYQEYLQATESRRNQVTPRSTGGNGVLRGSTSGVRPPYDPLNDPYSDEYYLNLIKQYEGDPMYDELLNNPYLLKNNKPFSPTWLQSFGTVFGDYAAENSYYENLLSLRNEFLSNWIASRNERNYETPSAQAERMALAGQNADLLGTGGVADAPENDQPMLGITQPGAETGVQDGLNFVFSVCQTGISLASSVMQLSQGIQSLRYGNEQIVAQELSNRSDAMKFLNDEMVNTLGISDISDIDKIDSQVYLRTLDDILEDESISKHTRKMLKRYRNTLQSDSGTALLHTMKMELAKRYNTARKDTADILADPNYDPEFADWIGKLSKYFNDYSYKATKAIFDAQTAQNEYTKKYYHGLDAGKASEYENAAYDSNKLAAENTAMVDELYNNIYKFLRSDDHWYSNLGLAFLPALRAYIMSMSIPSLNFSRPTTVNNIDNRKSQNVEGDYFNHFNN